MTKEYCDKCGKELIPARAFSDGEPTYVGVLPHECIGEDYDLPNDWEPDYNAPDEAERRHMRAEAKKLK